MHGVARLERYDRFPAAFLKGFARLGRLEPMLCERQARRMPEHRDLARQVHFARAVYGGDSRVFLVGRAVDVLHLDLLVGTELPAQMQDRERGFVFIAQDDVGAVAKLRGFVGGDGQRDRHGPDEPFRQVHGLDDGVVLRLRHEAFQRTETADRDHFETCTLAGVHRERRQRSGFFIPRCTFARARHAVDQRTAVRRDRICRHHVLQGSKRPESPRRLAHPGAAAKPHAGKFACVASETRNTQACGLLRRHRRELAKQAPRRSRLRRHPNRG
jgi:hypothetical protein